MKVFLLACLFAALAAAAFADSVGESAGAASLHFGVGTEFSTMGMGLSSANSLAARHGIFGFGGFLGFRWGVFAAENRPGAFLWNVYLSYEYPRWLGVFFAYGINYWQEYSYAYQTAFSEGRWQAEVNRPFFLAGLQRTLYFSGRGGRRRFVPGMYVGGTWIRGGWARETIHGTAVLRAGVRIDGSGRAAYSRAFPPADRDALFSAISSDDGRVSFFAGASINFDFPIRIGGSSRPEGD